jgi:hypothetical protein
MQAINYAKLVAKQIETFFGSKACDYYIRSADFGPGGSADLRIELEFLAYQSISVVITVERRTIYAAINIGSRMISLSKTAIEFDADVPSIRYLGQTFLSDLDSELRLRVPDKFLAAKGWA